MLASSRWLREYLPDNEPFERSLDRLTQAGVSVESSKTAGAGVSGVVVAHLLEVAPHPKADRLSVTKVSTGSDELQIVCGAKNIAPGQKVPLALVGASLPGIPRLEKAKIRGVESFGMMCSAKELGFAEESEGILLLPEDAPVGKDLLEYLHLPDLLFEVEITPNRPDLLSHFGIARELGALINRPPVFPADPVPVETAPDAASRVSLTVEDTTACPLYTCRVIEGVRVGPSPGWLREKLERLGHRSINNVVDVTNFILFELGQPLHAFDLDLLEGRSVVVRRARPGERIPLLDGTDKELNDVHLVIADSKRPVALAGIMGGRDTMVTGETKNILLESALFQPGVIRRTARRLGLSTDSSYRFERGVDPEMVRKALDRAAALIQKSSGGSLARGVVQKGQTPRNTPIPFRHDRCDKILGLEIPRDRQVGFLKSLGCAVDLDEKNPVSGPTRVHPPSWRVDLSLEIDLIEEVARMNGYDQVPVTGPALRVAKLPFTESPRSLTEIRRVFQRHGLTETVNTSFLPSDYGDRLRLESQDPLRLAATLSNPIAEDQKVLRPTLIPSLLANVQLNLSYQQEGAAFFEVNKVFRPVPGGGVEEALHAACVIAGVVPGSGWHTPSRVADFYDMKGLAEELLSSLAPGTSFRWEFSQEPAPFQRGLAFRVTGPGEKTLLRAGALDPKVKKAYDIVTECVVLEVDLDSCRKNPAKGNRVAPLPKFPAARRDLALVVPECRAASEIEDAIRESGGARLSEVALFDLYQGKNLPPGHRSLAWRLSFQAPDRTLTDAEVNERISEIVKILQTRYAVALR